MPHNLVMESPVRPHPESYSGTAIRSANWPADLRTVRRLFQDYRHWIDEHRDTTPTAEGTVTAGLRGIDKQIAELPGAYGPPRGEILLAFIDDEPVACGALRELEPTVGEIKRLYVRADHRGPEFGKILTSALLRRSRELGYERVRVDTLPTMFSAIQFYQELGFHPIPPYWPHPVRDAVFFEYAVGNLSSPQRALRASRSKRSGSEGDRGSP